MRIGNQKRVIGFRATSVVVAFGTLALASIWAIGRPGADPVGGVLGAVRSGVGNYADWAREGPIDGHPDWSRQFRPVAGGDAKNGPEVIRRHGCGACHIIPGVGRAHGTVGPSLADFANRAYIAGELPNRAETLVDFLRAPSDFTPDTAMPDTGLTEADAADAAAYLYTLNGRG